MHELRNAIGFKRITTSDPIEQEMRDIWYQRKQEHLDAGGADSGQTFQAFHHINEKLAKYCWDKAAEIVRLDRLAHPKAKRNQPVPARESGGPLGRVLP